jgi:hypothetical protein
MEVSGQLHAPTALPSGKDRSTHCVEDLLGPRAGLKAEEWKIISYPCRDRRAEVNISEKYYGFLRRL